MDFANFLRKEKTLKVLKILKCEKTYKNNFIEILKYYVKI